MLVPQRRAFDEDSVWSKLKLDDALSLHYFIPHEGVVRMYGRIAFVRRPIPRLYNHRRRDMPALGLNQEQSIFNTHPKRAAHGQVRTDVIEIRAVKLLLSKRKINTLS
jgi:hypothetical protein